MFPQEKAPALANIVVTIHNGYYTVRTDQALVIYPLRGLQKQRYRQTALRVRGEYVHPEALPRNSQPSASLITEIFPYQLLITQSALMGGFGLLIASVVGLMQYASTPANPFADYTDILPGGSSRALDTHGFECAEKSSKLYQHSLGDVCHLMPASGVFQYIAVTYTNGQISRVQFDVRDASLSLGDVTLFLDITWIDPRQPFMFDWHGYVGLVNMVKRTSPHVFEEKRVWQVTLTNTPMFKP